MCGGKVSIQSIGEILDTVQQHYNIYWLEHCTGIAEDRVRIPRGKPEFLVFVRLSFRNCISRVFNSEDLLHI